MEFKEEYWPDALSTLRREERKAFLKRWAPWLGVLLLLGGSAAGYGLYTHNASAALAQRGNTVSTTVDVEPLWSATQPAPAQKDAQVRMDAGTSDAAVQDFAASDPPLASATQTHPSANAAPTATADAGASAPQPTPASPTSANTVSQTSSDTSTPTQGSTPQPQAPAIGTPTDVSTASAGDVPALSDDAADLPVLPESPMDLRSAVLQQDDPARVAPFYVGNPLAAKPARVPHLAAAVASAPSKRPLTEQPFPWKQSGFNMSVGTSLMTGFGSRRGQYVFNPEIGVGYEYVSPDPHWSVRASANYFQIGGIAHAASFDQLEAGFGLTTTRTTIHTERLHFAYVPVEVFWNATRRFSLSGGAGVSYLVNGLSEVVVSRFDHDASTELDRFEDWGYVGGYRSLNASLLGGAEWRPNTRWILGAQYQHGLTRITKESIYGQTKQDRNSRLRVYLKFAL